MRSLLNLTLLLLELYTWALIISVILSWLYQFNVINTANQYIHMVSNFFYRITEPALRPIRRWMPGLGGIDISPLVLIIGIIFLRSLLVEYWPR